MADLNISVSNQGDGIEIYAQSVYQNYRVTRLGIPVPAEIVGSEFSVAGTLRSMEEGEAVDIDQLSEKSIKAIGAVLFEFLFGKEIFALYEHHRFDNPENILRLDFSDCPELNNYPWEMLYDKRRDTFLALSKKFSIIRYLPEQLVRRAPLSSRKQLKILFVISCETELNVEKEWNNINEVFQSAKADNLVVIDRLEPVNLESLQTKLHQFKPNILHFIGHSQYDITNQQGRIQLTNVRGESEIITPDNLGYLGSENKELLLLVLNSCQSSLTSPKLAYSGMAQRIIQMGMPAVVSMQREVNDSSAIIFATRLYQSIAASLPIEQAITEARISLHQQNKRIQDWYIPTLYSRSENKILFNFPKKESYREIYSTHKNKFILIAANAIFLVVILVHILSSLLYKTTQITIYDADHQPVPDATIEIAVLNYTGHTDAKGELTIHFFKKNYAMEFNIHKEGYIPKTSELRPGAQIHERIYKESSD